MRVVFIVDDNLIDNKKAIKHDLGRGVIEIGDRCGIGSRRRLRV